MVACKSNDHEVQRTLKMLVAMVRDHGGWLADDLEIRSDQGDLSIHSTRGRASDEFLIRLPRKCLLPADKFQVGLAGDELYLTSPAPDVDADQVELMQAMLSLYNATGKISRFRQTNPWLRGLADLEFLNLLRSARGYRPSGLEAGLQGDTEQFIVQSFLNARFLLFHGSDDQDVKVLAPIVDLLNHHPRGGENEA